MVKSLYKYSTSVLKWFDAEVTPGDGGGIAWVRCIPFALMHLACLLVFVTGWSPFAVGTAVVFYLVRMFAITGFYHRYFSHHSFKSGRLCQFVFALVGCAAVQRGPLWWAAHHRHHHRHSDDDQDIHSPLVSGFWHSHVLWITKEANFATNYSRIRDFARYAELRFLNRFDMVVPILFATAIFGLGTLLEAHAPSLGTNGPQLLVWGFFVSTVVLYHATFSINSLAHVYGSRRYETRDHSRNNWWLALITLGEGWHNNHHRYPGSVRQGHTWWEIDLTWYGLALLSKLGLIWDLKPVPKA